MPKPQPKTAFPSQMYIYICDYADKEPIFEATTEMDEVDAGELIGTYRLHAVSRHQVTHALVEP